MSFNKIFILGNLGRDPEIKATPQGKKVAIFSVASNDRRKDPSGEYKTETTWFRVSVWERQAELAEKYLKKGQLVFIEGRLQSREWTDKDGRTRLSLEVTATELQLLGSREEAVSKDNPTESDDDTITIDDIPF